MPPEHTWSDDDADPPGYRREASWRALPLWHVVLLAASLSAALCWIGLRWWTWRVTPAVVAWLVVLAPAHVVPHELLHLWALRRLTGVRGRMRIGFLSGSVQARVPISRTADIATLLAPQLLSVALLALCWLPGDAGFVGRCLFLLQFGGSTADFYMVARLLPFSRASLVYADMDHHRFLVLRSLLEDLRG